jgi:hypothetical protein
LSTGADHQVVGQQHGKGLVHHHALRAQHRMAQAQGLGLADVDAVHVVGLDGAHQVQQLLLAGRFQLVLELEGGVEVVSMARLLRPVTKIIWRMPAA